MAPRWKIATVTCAILLTTLLIIVLSTSILIVRDTLALKHAAANAIGDVKKQIPQVNNTLPVPTVPTASPAPTSPAPLHPPFARFACDLVARLEHNLAAPPSLETIGTIDSHAGRNNGWLLKTPNNNTLWFVLRGTATREEWAKDFQIKQVSFLARMGVRLAGRIAYPNLINAPLTQSYLGTTASASAEPAGDGSGGDDTEILTHSGFMEIYTSLRATLLDALQTTADNRIDTSLPLNVCITGHSLGAAVAQIATLDICTLFPDTRVDTVVFGSPRVGNIEFTNALLTLHTQPTLNSFHSIVNTCDLVTNIPLAVQPTISPPYKPQIYNDLPRDWMHVFTENRKTWVANHLIQIYTDYCNSI